MKKYSYWCSWRTQNALSHREGETSPVLFQGDCGAKLARATMNETVIFGAGGMAEQYPAARGEMLFMLDDGWDVPYSVHPDENRHLFSSMILNEQRFPSFGGTPPERLAALQKRMRALGWRGIGLWVACQPHGKPRAKTGWDESELLRFWQTRLEWCKQAGITYIKLDWGEFAHDSTFRRRVSELAREISPETIIEHAAPCEPLNDYTGTGRFSGSFAYGAMAKLCDFSKVLRTYDVSPQLSVPTTIDRCACLLEGMAPGCRCILNCEDEAYIGAALGLAIGAMRSKWCAAEGERGDPAGTFEKLLEIERAIEWQKIAPPFSSLDCVGNGARGTETSAKILTDSWLFSEGDFWWGELVGREARQSAPAAVARNMRLPVVTSESDDVCYTLCSRHPNGATAVAVCARVSPKGVRRPDTTVELEILDLSRPIGVFGVLHELVLRLPGGALPGRVLYRELLSDREQDITGECSLCSGLVRIPGWAMKGENTAPDRSEPGGVLLFVPTQGDTDSI